MAKPSANAAATAQLLGEIAQASGLPAGVFNLVQGRGGVAGSALVEHPGLSTIAFAGRTETGRLIQKSAAEYLKRTQLSLGACNAAVIFTDADLEKAVSAVVKLSLSSLTPRALRVTRIFVQDPIHAKFLEMFKEAAAKLVIAEPLNEATDLGPLRRRALAEAHLQDAKMAGGEKGKSLLGNSKLPPKGYFVEPMAFADLTQCSTLQQTDVAGPLALVSSFKYQHDALKYMGNSPFALASYLFHGDGEKLQKIAAKFETARVFLNVDEPAWSPAMEFDGLKDSGLGREGLPAWMRFFSRESTIIGGMK